MSFYLNYFAPTLQKNLHLKEINFLQYKTLNKFLINNNNLHIQEYFDTILKECLVEDVELTNFDKFCALFLLRCTCISPEIEFYVGTTTKKASLMNFLKKCLDFNIEFSKKIKIDESIEVVLNLPKSFVFETTFDALYETISEVFYNGKRLIYNSNAELMEVLPADILTHLKDYSKNLDKEFKNLVLDVGVREKDQFSVSPFNLSMFEVLRALFNSNFRNILELQYLLVSKCRYNPDYVDKNTLMENLILANIYEDEVKKINEEQDKALEKTKPGNK